MNLPAISLRDRVHAIEFEMKRFDQIEIPVRHIFGGGIYCREIRIPAGVLLTGKIHKYEHVNIMSAGEMSVLTETGILRVRAPFATVSKPGIKRVAYVHEAAVWTTVHRTDLTDPDEIEEHFIAQSEADYLTFIAAEDPACLS